MQTLRSYVAGRWHTADRDFVPLVDPSTEEPIARASSAGIDFGAVVEHARRRGGPALRALTFAQRAGLLKEMGRTLRENRDELLELSRRNTGTTRPDGAFDVDGASGTLSWYAGFGRRLGERRPARRRRRRPARPQRGLLGPARPRPAPRRGGGDQRLQLPRLGLRREGRLRAARRRAAGGQARHRHRAGWRRGPSSWCWPLLPEGALQLVCGGTGDLLDRLGPQDVLAFTGSADTARALRGRDPLLAAATRVNVEADSLNAAVLAPGAAGATFELFLRDVVREMTQKSGQKCTAVRRILVPAERTDEVEAALAARLAEVVTGDPADASVTMGPLATADQLADSIAGVAELAAVARLVHGAGRRTDGAGAPAGRGFFLAPTLLRADRAREATAVHDREVFAPVATLLPYDGTAADAAEIVALGGGTLVTSVYADDVAWTADFLAGAAATTGRVYLGSQGSAEEAPGSGIALPQTLHGGPGRAGGGAELGGLVGMELYLQRVALQGARDRVDELAGRADAG